MMMVKMTSRKMIYLLYRIVMIHHDIYHLHHLYRMMMVVLDDMEEGMMTMMVVVHHSTVPVDSDMVDVDVVDNRMMMTMTGDSVVVDDSDEKILYLDNVIVAVMVVDIDDDMTMNVTMVGHHSKMMMMMNVVDVMVVNKVHCLDFSLAEKLWMKVSRANEIVDQRGRRRNFHVDVVADVAAAVVVVGPFGDVCYG